jgi:ABC-type methionine transport system ATPase subunit
VVSIKDGRVVGQGTVSDVLSKDTTLAHQVEMEEIIEEAKEETKPDGDKKKASDGQGKLIVAEEVQIGNVGWP